MLRRVYFLFISKVCLSCEGVAMPHTSSFNGPSAFRVSKEGCLHNHELLASQASLDSIVSFFGVKAPVRSWQETMNLTYLYRCRFLLSNRCLNVSKKLQVLGR